MSVMIKVWSKGGETRQEWRYSSVLQNSVLGLSVAYLNYCGAERSLYRNSSSKIYLQIVCQVVFLQSMCFKAMWGCVKIVVADSTNKTFGLETQVVATNQFYLKDTILTGYNLDEKE